MARELSKYEKFQIFIDTFEISFLNSWAFDDRVIAIFEKCDLSKYEKERFFKTELFKPDMKCLINILGLIKNQKEEIINREILQGNIEYFANEELKEAINICIYINAVKPRYSHKEIIPPRL